MSFSYLPTAFISSIMVASTVVSGYNMYAGVNLPPQPATETNVDASVGILAAKWSKKVLHVDVNPNIKVPMRLVGPAKPSSTQNVEGVSGNRKVNVRTVIILSGNKTVIKTVTNARTAKQAAEQVTQPASQQARKVAATRAEAPNRTKTFQKNVSAQSGTVYVKTGKSAAFTTWAGTWKLFLEKKDTGSSVWIPTQKKIKVKIRENDSKHVFVPVVYKKRGGDLSSPSNPKDPVEYPPEGKLAEVFALVNQVRAAGVTCGNQYMEPADPVRYDSKLGLAAQRHSEDMAAQNYFDHVSKDGTTFVQRIRRAGYTGYPGGENIASGHPDAVAVMKGWLNSPGHCVNLMDPDWSEMGLGYAERQDPGYSLPVTYWTQEFGYTAD